MKSGLWKNAGIVFGYACERIQEQISILRKKDNLNISFIKGQVIYSEKNQQFLYEIVFEKPRSRFIFPVSVFVLDDTTDDMLKIAGHSIGDNALRELEVVLLERRLRSS